MTRVKSLSAKQALLTLAKREARADGRRSRLIAVIVAMPTLLLAAFVVVLGTSFETEPWAPLFLANILNPVGVVISGFIVGLLFLVSLAAFAVGDRQSERTYRLLVAAGADGGHIRRLAIYRSMVPGTIGVLLGVVTGTAVGIAISILLGNTLQRTHWISVPLGVAVPALLAWAGVLVGAWWPTRSAVSRPQKAVAQTAATTTRPRIRSSRRSGPSLTAGVMLVVVSLAALVVGTATYNYVGLSWLRVPEQLAYPLLTIAPLGLIAGLVLLLPSLLRIVSARLDRGPGWLRFGFADLARNRGRAGLAGGVTLALATLAVMAAAGIKSDEDWYVEIDDRYVVTSHVDQDATAAIEEVLSDVRYERFDVNTVTVGIGLPLDNQDQIHRWSGLRAAIVDDDLAAALELDDSQLDALAGGTMLVNSRSELFDRASISLGRFDEVPIARIDHGEGSDSPLTLLVDGNLADDAGLHTITRVTAFVAAADLDGETRDRIAEAAGRHQVGVSVTGGDPLDNLDVATPLTVVMAGLAITIATLTALLALRADHHTLDVVDDLGAGPRGRRLLAATQVGLQQLVAAVVGVVTGVGLFRTVTYGDRSVPNWVFPWPTMATMALAVPVITALAVGLSAPRRRPAATAPHTQQAMTVAER